MHDSVMRRVRIGHDYQIVIHQDLNDGRLPVVIAREAEKLYNRLSEYDRSHIVKIVAGPPEVRHLDAFHPPGVETFRLVFHSCCNQTTLIFKYEITKRGRHALIKDLSD